MSRLQLALNVSDLDAAVDFYSKLFASEPSKRMPSYANFAIADPPLKLVLVEGEVPGDDGVTGKLNHLGVEVMSSDEVAAAITRLSGEGLDTTVEQQSICCYAVQDKVWVADPDGAPWEVYAVVADAPAETGLNGDGLCCPTEDAGERVTLGATPTANCC